MPETNTPTPGAEYLSNNGRGPLRARVLSVDGRIVTLERWNEKSKRRRLTRFKLAVRFLASPACGWKLARAATR